MGVFEIDKIVVFFCRCASFYEIITINKCALFWTDNKKAVRQSAPLTIL